MRDIRPSERNGPVVGVLVEQADDVMLISTGGMVTRTHVDQIRVTGRNTQGVRLVNLKDGDTVSSLARIAKEETPEPAEEAAPAG